MNDMSYTQIVDAIRAGDENRVDTINIQYIFTAWKAANRTRSLL